MSKKFVVFFPGDRPRRIVAADYLDAKRKAEEAVAIEEAFSKKRKNTDSAVVVGEKRKYFLKGKEVSGKEFRNYFMKNERELTRVDLIKKLIREGISIGEIKKDGLL